MDIIRSETPWRESLAKSLTEIPGKTGGETLGETFRAKESRRESRIGLYA